LGDILIEVYAAHPILQDPLQVVPLSFLVCSQLDLFDVHALLQVQDDLILLYCSPQTGLDRLDVRNTTEDALPAG
jgi:hypothetical protein